MFRAGQAAFQQTCAESQYPGSGSQTMSWGYSGGRLDRFGSRNAFLVVLEAIFLKSQCQYGWVLVLSNVLSGL